MIDVNLIEVDFFENSEKERMFKIQFVLSFSNCQIIRIKRRRGKRTRLLVSGVSLGYLIHPLVQAIQGAHLDHHPIFGGGSTGACHPTEM